MNFCLVTIESEMIMEEKMLISLLFPYHSVIPMILDDVPKKPLLLHDVQLGDVPQVRQRDDNGELEVKALRRL